MPVLSLAQRRAGRELGSLSAVADSKQTLLCTYLSAILLVGLVLNSMLGWSWADPVAALGIAAIAVREGVNAWRGDPAVMKKGGDMPVVALVLFVVFAALGFGWRSWEQRRRTGSTGFRGISGRLGSIEWFAGVGFVVAMGVAVFAPILQLLGVVSPLGVLHAPWIQIAGIVIAVIGIAATVYAQLEMGDSWRIGVDPSETTTLVRTGVFGWVRNPIFTAMMTFGFGIALLTPNLVAIAGFVLLVATIELQVRIVEEPYLLTTHGDAYSDYLAAVGRFVPGVGRV